MKGFRTLFLSGCILLFFFDCFAYQETIKLKLDNVTASPGAIKEGVFRLLGSHLYYLNVISREIKVFNVKTGGTIKSIPLDKDGPDFIGPEPYSFQILSEDSILVFSNFSKKQMILVNDFGKVLKRYETSMVDVNGVETLNGLLARGPSNIAIQNGKAFVLEVLLQDNVLKSHSPLAEIDIASGELRNLDQPKQYNSAMHERLNMIMQIMEGDIVTAEGGNLLVLSYPLDHSLYISGDGFNSFEKIKSKSKYFGDFKLMNKPKKSMTEREYHDQGFDVLVLSGQYLGLLYDPYRSLYYRITRIPQDEKIYKSYKQKSLSRLPPRLHSVMVLDKDFNILSEKTYPILEYRFRTGMFVGPEGLYVLKPEGDNEDEMIFELLKFK